MKCSKIRIIGIPEGGGERGLEGILEQIITENFPNLGKETNIHDQEAERTPPRINKNRPIPWYIIVNLLILQPRKLPESS